MENYRFLWLQTNYKISKNKHSLDVSALLYGKELYYLEGLKTGDLLTYQNANFNFLYGYDFLKSKNLTITSNAGLGIGSYTHSEIIGVPNGVDCIL